MRLMRDYLGQKCCYFFVFCQCMGENYLARRLSSDEFSLFSSKPWGKQPWTLVNDGSLLLLRFLPTHEGKTTSYRSAGLEGGKTNQEKLTSVIENNRESEKITIVTFEEGTQWKNTHEVCSAAEMVYRRIQAKRACWLQTRPEVGEGQWQWRLDSIARNMENSRRSREP
ncbi:hypothetical protein CEXT_267061 [Caerostris extrusa]|uniref:Uncharacterized protein n=1 Tax=Caerostris extrusa TaxID=172846 RepID=A0AAV4U3I2_CAEEX|nr:hypothetical protein CEXT_267061 [Caerostris extrusa]